MKINKTVRHADVLCYAKIKKNIPDNQLESMSKEQLHTVHNALTLHNYASIAFQNTPYNKVFMYIHVFMCIQKIKKSNALFSQHK